MGTLRIPSEKPWRSWTHQGNSPALTVASDASTRAGTYIIYAFLGSLASDNYSFQLANVTLSVLPASPTDLRITSGGVQSTKAGRAFVAPLRVRLTARFQLTNDEQGAPLELSFSMSAISEKSGTATGTLRRNTPLGTAMTVALSSSDILQATVPQTVLFEASSDVVEFALNAVDDEMPE